MEAIEAARIIITLGILIYALVLDLRSRTIDSRLWKILGLGGLLILAVQMILGSDMNILPALGLSLFTAIIFSYTMYWLGLMGGGDAKLLMALSIMHPILPAGKFIIPLFFLSVFTNAILISLTIPILFFLRNIPHIKDVRNPRNLIRLFIAYQKDAAQLGRFETPLEEGQLYVSVKEAVLGETSAKGMIWVTPAIPFVLFLTLGYLASISYGDLAYSLAILYKAKVLSL